MKNKFFESQGMVINNILHLSPSQAYAEAQRGAIFLDLRRSYEIAYKAFDVENKIYSSPQEIKENYQNLPVDKPLIVADNAGIRSKQIVEFLAEQGFENIANLIGGMFEWDKDNLPIALNQKERLSGSCLCMLKPMGKIRND